MNYPHRSKNGENQAKKHQCKQHELIDKFHFSDSQTMGRFASMALDRIVIPDGFTSFDVKDIILIEETNFAIVKPDHKMAKTVLVGVTQDHTRARERQHRHLSKLRIDCAPAKTPHFFSLPLLCATAAK